MNTLASKLKNLSSAEEFMDYFGIAYEQHVLNVNRLHILKRFHDYVSRRPGLDALCDDEMRAAYRECLLKAYEDFVRSDALTEKVFKVLQKAAGIHPVKIQRMNA
jgi:nitrogenase-stabilizing/protective protein